MTSGWLRAAGAANHRSFFAASAAAVEGSVQHRYGGVVTCQPGGGVTVGFPRVPAGELSDFADEILRFARQNRPPGEVGWWLLDESDVPAVGARLLARGFDWGWRPTWMALDVVRLVEEHPIPAGLVIRPTETGFDALLDNGRLGGITFHVCDFDDQPIGGIYQTEVEPDARRQGIGTGLTVAAARRARELGCRYVLLNATGLGRPVYQRAGFELLGEAGQTWWLPKARVEAAPPSRSTVEFAEAVGLGELEAMERALRAEPRDLDASLPGGLTPLAVAATVGQPASARWLVSRGATLDVVSAWDLGWRDEAVDALARDPALVDWPTGGWKLTPSQIAAQRGDVELARVLLAATSDRTGKDAT